MKIELLTYEALIILISLLGIVLINPIGDAIRDKGNKRLQKSIEIFRDFLFFVIIYIVTKDIMFTLWMGSAYFFFRISVHNLAYNLTTGKEWWFTGTTSKSDDIEKGLSWSKNHILTVRIIFFLGALGCFYLGTLYK